MDNIKKKKEKIRNDFRQIELNEMKQRMRNQILDITLKEEERISLNQIIENKLNSSENPLIVDSRVHQNIELINPENINRIFDHLKAQTNDKKNIQLLTMLIKLKYNDIFENKKYLQRNKQFLSSFYQNLNEKIMKYQLNEINEETLAIFLKCYQVIIYSECSSEKNLFYKFSTSLYFIETYLIQWFFQLYQNSSFLMTFSIICQENQIFADQKFSQLFMNNYTILERLSYQSNPESTLDKKLVVPSLYILISLIYQSPNFSPNSLIQCLKILMSISVIIHKYQANNKKYFKKGNIIKVFKCIKKLMQQVNQSKICIDIGLFMNTANFWNLCTLMLQTETQTIRIEVYKVLQLCIKSLYINQIDIQSYLRLDTLALIIEGLQSNSDERIILACLKITLVIIQQQRRKKYSNSRLIENMINWNIINFLEYLQYHNLLQITKIATNLLENEFRNQNYPQEYI